MDPILEIRNITKKFGGLTAVDDFNMHLAAGEVVGLLGDNGAGKSTVIKMISGVYPPTKGQILFPGKRDQNPKSHGCPQHGHRDDIPGPCPG